MKRLILVVLLAVVFACGCARTARIGRPLVSKPLLEQIPEPRSHLTVGERFTFLVAWGKIPIGRATATVEKLMTFKEYEVYKVVVTAKTNKILSKLFPVKDTFTSYIDKTTLTSRHYEAIIREGKYKKDLVVDYDFEKSIAIYTNLLDGSVKQTPIEHVVHDPISATYFFRTLPIRTGDTIEMTVNLNEKNYEVIAEIDERVNISLPRIGSFDAFLVKPYVKLHGKRQRRGKVWGYVSSGEKRICSYIVVKVLEIPWIGNVSATLESIEYISPAED